ncbi:MAG: phosphoribosylformylglycinamidine synthase subunit PurL [Pyrinomonadaceae bacterium]|nr:phosphoribosylformylglycinamidine synthase subunit PurL [Pyrinomonadaceae bacterium]MCX7639204.1 phosphoribosylformylglycinamidine synthase subunit PurL [Pyrinomonadaceae bacterium]MDW8303574.1 phosphoribosylformylglycinamidine synthase subunit PurL [Acidobacteriota bacterium]
MKTEFVITDEVVAQHNLTKEEYKQITEILGREPNLTELGIFSVMWSEHCSYKSSKIHLKRLPTNGERVIVPPGENAGVVDIGEGWCIAFKIESHNHPSFIEPFQGAATGVGGILRDVFTMGARPIAAMNSLRFGRLDNPKHGKRNKSIMRGVVAGIAHYGNCFGVPTVGGEVFFDDSYSLNPLVNAFALGIVRKEHIFFGKAAGIGNPVVYVGARTGRDGIHGAIMASAEFDESALKKRPTVQVGDPFLEKLLLEACLEAMRSGAIEGIQDMGAAGLTSSSVEMASRAGTGIELYLDLVPQRETNMTAYEMMLSESQERMLIVAKSGREKEIIEIFNKWELDAVVIGKVIEEKRLKVFHKGILQADLPIEALTENAPKYNRPLIAPKRRSTNIRPKAQAPDDFNEAFITLLSSPNICSRRWVYEQYDHMVRTNTVVLPGADAAVIRIKETRFAVSMSLDGNGKFCAINPRLGAQLTVAEAARNNVCVGAKPIAVTNCLNFASPERPEVMWSFSEVIDGMAEACKFFETPIVSGNVSFYNETEGKGVLPTPIIGMIGLIEDTKKIVTQGFKSEGDLIALLGDVESEIEASEYEQVILKISTEELIDRGKLPSLDLGKEKAIQDACLKLADEMLIKSAHDISEGGLAVALAESCFSSLNRKAVGAEINLPETTTSIESLLFGESPSRIIISFAEENLQKVEETARNFNCPFQIIGKVKGNKLKINVGMKQVISVEIDEIENLWKNALEGYLSAR